MTAARQYLAFTWADPRQTVRPYAATRSLVRIGQGPTFQSRYRDHISPFINRWRVRLDGVTNEP